MSRITRSRTKITNNEKVEEVKYVEQESDVDDEADNVKPKKESRAIQKSRKSSMIKTKSQASKVEPKDEHVDQQTKDKDDEIVDNHEPENVDDEFDQIDYELSEKEMKQINRAFDMNLPSLGDENLASGNLKTAMRLLGYEPRTIEIRKLMKKFSNSKGKINRDGFHKIMAYKYSTSPGLNEKTANDEISKVFNLFDIDKTGKISLENLKSIARELDEALTEEELLEMITEADQDGDQLIDKNEFQNIMKKTSLY